MKQCATARARITCLLSSPGLYLFIFYVIYTSFCREKLKIIMEGEASTSQSVKKVECEMPWPAYSHVFDFRPNLSNENNFAFACKFCAAGKIIHANKTSAANLKKHINTCKESKQYQTLYIELNMQHRTARHPYKLKEIEKAKELIKTKRHNEDSLENPLKKQKILDRWGSRNVSQKMLNDAVLRFIIEDIQHLSIVDSPAFINLVSIGLPSSVRIMCRKTLKTKLNQTYIQMKSALENKLVQLEVVSTTADLWSKAKRSFFGMTVHWINPDNLKRESAALACRRMKGRHTYDILAKTINSIFLEYHIQNKTCSMTTDNGSNFVKAFQAFERIENEDEDSSTEFHNLNDLLATADEEDTNEDVIILPLPPHQRCASHTLNLIAKDTEKLLEDNVLYKRKYRIIFGKLSKLWSKQNQSTQIADKIKETCGVYLKTPVITRWNSTFDCVFQLVTLLKQNIEQINQCMDYCNLQRLTDEDIKFLEEYCQVMEPLARALDILQSDTGMYMGYFLPVLNTLQQKLKNFKKTNLTYCHSLVDTIQQSLNKRFLATFERKELIIATSLHPKFKLKWITGDKKKLAESYLQELLGILPIENTSKVDKSDDDNDFFIFEEQGTTHQESEDEELQRFLKSRNSNIEMLNEYPNIKKHFIKYNTPLPSSASVERMFSVGGSVLTPQRGHLHDDTIEQQILY